MPRRRLEPPPTDRLAVILGIPPVASAADAPPRLVGWVPQRSSVTRMEVPPPTPGGALIGPASAASARPTPAQGSSSCGRHRRAVPPKPAILTVPTALRGLRARPTRMAVLGVLILLVGSALVLGVRVALARSSAQPKPIAASAHGPPVGLVTRTVPAAFATKGVSGPTTAAGFLLVHVVGQVRHQGVVRLAPGSRVLDAVQAAGGASPSADLNNLNLARAVVDGEQIVVPKPGEKLPVGAPSGAAGVGPTSAGSVGGVVDLNTADAAALDSLPGVGPVIAQRILDWRTQHGRFTSVDELGEVSGIGDKLIAQIAPKVRV
jgi:competence protein ComEA